VRRFESAVVAERGTEEALYFGSVAYRAAPYERSVFDHPDLRFWEWACRRPAVVVRRLVFDTLGLGLSGVAKT